MTHPPDPIMTDTPGTGTPGIDTGPGGTAYPRQGASPQDQAPHPRRQWSPRGEEVLSEAYAKARWFHGDYDRQRVRDRISEEIQNLIWQPPNGPLPLSTGLFLQTVVPQMPMRPVTAIAINGALEYPDGPDLALLGVYGVEGMAGPSRWRMYVLDLGVIGVPLALDEDVPHPALEPPGQDDAQDQPDREPVPGPGGAVGG